eukprot:1160824-Pelagomonas_calceolata.AAC.3
MNDAKSPASDPARSSHTKVVTPPGGAPFAFAPPPDFRVCITLLSSSAALPTLLAAASSSCSCSCCACCRCCSSSGVNTGLGAREGVVGRKKGAASGFLGGCKGLHGREDPVKFAQCSPFPSPAKHSSALPPTVS